MQMQTILMNFGDNMRVVNDSKNIPHSIDIGKITEFDVHDVHLRMLQKGMRKETLIAIDQETLQHASKKLVVIMECLKEINSQDYDALLEKFNTINGPNPENIRPTRDMMRIALRELAKQEVNAMVDRRKQFIREAGDEETRKEITPQPKPAKPPETPAPREKLASATKAKTSQKGQSKPKTPIKRERL